MQFSWPLLLILLLLIPALAALYVWMLRRRRRFAVRYPSLSLVRAALPKFSRLRQHLPFALMLSALALLIIGAARPAAEVQVPLSRTTIILALDASRSMCATDITPNRLSVAQEAALAFIEEQPEGTRIGIVAFAGFAELIVPPTQDKEVLANAVSNLTTSIGTAIGSATLKSIDAIAEINDAVEPSGVSLEVDGERPAFEDGFFNPDIIVLLTDGANTQGVLPLMAAQQAADRGLRVYTIGFGTTNPTQMVCSERQIGSDSFSRSFGGFGAFGGVFGGGGYFRQFLLLDEPTLQGIADLTGGEYFRAESADQLFEIFLNLPSNFVLQSEYLEISFLFLVLGGLLAGAALWLSLRWNRFP